MFKLSKQFQYYMQKIVTHFHNNKLRAKKYQTIKMCKETQSLEEIEENYQVVSTADFLTARLDHATTLPELRCLICTGVPTLPIS